MVVYQKKHIQYNKADDKKEKNRNSIEVRRKVTASTTMNVIVLLILAGVTIAMLMGDNGILTKATEAK